MSIQLAKRFYLFIISFLLKESQPGDGNCGACVQSLTPRAHIQSDWLDQVPEERWGLNSHNGEETDQRDQMLSVCVRVCDLPQVYGGGGRKWGVIREREQCS